MRQIPMSMQEKKESELFEPDPSQYKKKQNRKK